MLRSLLAILLIWATIASTLAQSEPTLSSQTVSLTKGGLYKFADATEFGDDIFLARWGSSTPTFKKMQLTRFNQNLEEQHQLQLNLKLGKERISFREFVVV